MKNSPYTKKNIITFVCATLGFLLFIYSRTGGFCKTPLESLAQSITYPILYITSSLSHHTKSLFEKRDSYYELKNKFSALQSNYDSLEQKFIQLSAEHHHYEKIKELCEFRSRFNLPNTILAQILTRNFSSQSHYFIINKGSAHGISENMIALYKLQIIGKVSSVTPFYSKVMSITDQYCNVAAFTNTTNAPGILTGMNEINKCKLDYVSHLHTVQQEDLVFSSGQGTIFPEGFCVGKIASSIKNKKSLYHDIIIEPLINLEKIDTCLLTSQAKITLQNSSIN